MMAQNEETRIYHFRGTLRTFKCIILSPTRKQAIDMAYEQYRRVTDMSPYRGMEEDEVVLEKSEPISDKCITILLHYTE